MLWSLAIRMNETVIDSALRRGDTLLHFSAAFSRQPLKQFEQFLKTNGIALEEVGDILVSPQIFHRVMVQPSSAAMAYFTTVGFEDWLNMNRPIVPGHFSLFPRRSKTFVDSNLVFGIHERTMADGTVTREPQIEELEQIWSKLEMQSIQHIALSFVHAIKNNKNQNVVRDFLLSKGAKVFCSHEPFDFLLRSRLACYSACLSWHLDHELTSDPLLAWLKSNVLLEKAKFVTRAGTSQSLQGNEVEKFFASDREWIGRGASAEKPRLYLGYDNFLFYKSNNAAGDSLESSLGTLPLQTSAARFLVQPLSKISDGLNQFGLVDEEEIRSDPGPMRFGRGRSVCALDVIGLLNDLDGLEESKSQAGKIGENLITMFRSRLEQKSSGMGEISEELNSALASMVIGEAIELATNDSLLVGGPLAGWLMKENEKMGRPLDLQLVQWTSPAEKMLGLLH